MKKHYISALAAVSMLIGATAYANTIWTEDFESYSEGTGIDGTGNKGDYPASVSKWTLDISGADLGGSADDYIKTVGGEMEARDTDGPVVLTTESISIVDYTDVKISVDISEDGDLEAADYVDFEYRVDGGLWTLIANWNDLGTDSHTLVGTKPDDNDWESETVTVSGLTGSTLEIRFAINNNADTEYIQIDNLTVNDNSDAPATPELTIESPADGSFYENAVSSVAISGTATNISGMIVWSNELNDLSGEIAATNDWNFTGVTLAEGVNTILITATNLNGLSASDSVRLTRGLDFPTSEIGSIAFTGFNTQTDSFSFVVLKELAASTVIRFADGTWNGIAFGTTEDELVWSNDTVTEAGTIVEFYKCDLLGTISNNIGIIVRGKLVLGQSGDGIIAYYGDAEREPSAFLAAISSNSDNLNGTGLVYGDTAVDISTTPKGQYYSGARSGEKEWSGYLVLVNDETNWSEATGSVASSGDPTPFTRKKGETIILVK